jgi:hypothetical protein
MLRREASHGDRKGAGRVRVGITAVALGLATLPAMLWFFPVPLRFGSFVLLGPSSYSRFEIVFACPAFPDPDPTHVHRVRLHQRRRTEEFWARTIQWRYPFIILMRSPNP